jgi:DNA polymerase (family 10)
MSVTNAEIAELLFVTSDAEEDRKQKALRRAARASLMWPEECAAILARGGALTELPTVGPYVERVINGWFESPPDVVPEPPPNRSGFITLAAARDAIAADPGRIPRADLQMHTTETDGADPLEVMVDACRRYEYIAITDHSKELTITNGMDEERLAAQGARIDALNDARSEPPRVLRSIEMNLSPEGEGDMEPGALAQLDLVLGAFHSKLRMKEDQTQRYVAALRNPTIDVLAHPRTKMYGVRPGLPAEWDVVFEAAAEEGVVLEIDCHPFRQDLDVELLKVAVEYDVTFSIGTDAHSTGELEHMELGIAHTILAGIPPERVLNFNPWSGAPRRR